MDGKTQLLLAVGAALVFMVIVPMGYFWFQGRRHRRLARRRERGIRL
jgi:uncharacterized protein (DUF2062 family)